MMIAPPQPGINPMRAPITGCHFFLDLIQSTNRPAVRYCNQLNKRTITATNTVTARNASRIETRTVSSRGSRGVTRGYKTYHFPIRAGYCKGCVNAALDVFFMGSKTMIWALDQLEQLNTVAMASIIESDGSVPKSRGKNGIFFLRCQTWHSRGQVWR